MPGILDELQGTLSGGALDEISKLIGADPGKTGSAVQGALPMLLAALGQQAGDPDRRDGLRKAITEDHDGSVLDDLSGYLTGQMGGRSTNGAGILHHVLGERQQAAVQGLSARSGLDMSSISALLPLLAPIVMGMLGKKQRGGMSFDDLAGALGGDAKRAQNESPDLGDLLGGVLGGSGAGGSGAKGGLGDILGSMLGGKDR